MSGTITDKLRLLENTKAGIKQAIINKGVAVSTSDAFSTYPAKIAAIPTGGGGGSEDHGGQYHILVVDYDGTILKEDHLNTGEVFTMPNAPTHDRLVFAEWSSSQELVNNTIVVADNDVIAGPIYDTVSGLNEFDVEVNTAAGMTVNLPMDGTKNWGDGTTDDTTSHTYTNAGEYTITCTGTKFTAYIASTSTPDWTYKHIRLTNITQFVNYTFEDLKNLRTINLPKNSPQMYSGMFRQSHRLKCCVLPSGALYYQSSMFQENYALEYVVPHYSMATLMQGTVFEKCYSLKYLILPKGVNFASNHRSAYTGMFNVKEIGWTANEIMYAPSYVDMKNLKRIVCTSNVTAISPGGSSSFLTDAANLEVIDFSKAIAVPTVNQVMFSSGYNKQLKIKVPAALYNDWIVATNWATYADNIVAVDANGNEV